MRIRLAVVTSAAWVAACASNDEAPSDDPNDTDTPGDDCVGTTTVGPLAYLDATDSPWAGTGLSVFVIEDMEDMALPEGVAAVPFSWTSIVFSPTSVDSVDGDDGVPTDNACPNCQSMWTDNAITFTFDPVVLGGLPTHVGIVLTDLAGTSATVTLVGTAQCGELDPFSTLFEDDGLFLGETYEDRFVGLVAPDGMTTFTVSFGVAAEVDHLQFGW